jgi:hypothetical protein
MITPAPRMSALVQDNVADIDTDTEFDPPVLWDIGIAGRHCLVDLAPMCLERSQRFDFVGAQNAAIPRHIGCQNGRKPSLNGCFVCHRG